MHAKEGQLEIVNDLLGLIVLHGPTADFDIWVMNDYGNRESWTKHCSVEQFTEFSRPCGYWKDDLLLMVEKCVYSRLFFYNLRTQESKNVLELEQFYYRHFCSYVETLVPISQRNAVAENADE